MKLQDGLILYHGSYASVTEIDLEKCQPGKDFGRGFYLTTDPRQARGFIAPSLRKARALGLAEETQRHGYISTFRYSSFQPDPSSRSLPDADKQWLWFVALNRRRSLAEMLEKKIAPELLSAEIISGKIANDNTNPVITTYLNGLYGPVEEDLSAQTAIRLLLPNRLKDQYCFLTENAINHLSFVEVMRYDV